MATKKATEKTICNINVIFTNVITNVANPEYIHVDGVNLENTDIPAGVAVVSKDQYDKIADVIGLAIPGRFSVGQFWDPLLGVNVIVVFDAEDNNRPIATRFFNVKGVQ